MVHILQNWGQKYELDAGGRVAANQEELQMWNLVYKMVCVCLCVCGRGPIAQQNELRSLKYFLKNLQS